MDISFYKYSNHIEKIHERLVIIVNILVNILYIYWDSPTRDINFSHTASTNVLCYVNDWVATLFIVKCSNVAKWKTMIYVFLVLMVRRVYGKDVAQSITF